MPDKDQFTFDDDDDFPETNPGGRKDSLESYLGTDDNSPEADLSGVFSDGEHEAEKPMNEEPEPKAKGGGSSMMRIILMVLLLVVVVAAGAYYFMGLGGTTPSVPTVLVPAQKTKKSVALPPQTAKAPVVPAKAPVIPTQAGEAAKPVTVAVPPPPPPAETEVTAAEKTADKAAEKTAPAKQPAIAAKPQPVLVPQSAKKTVAEKPKPVKQTAIQVVAPATKQVAGGAYGLDAGSYLLESNRKILAAKIKKLGYEPIITPVDATLHMTRLRLGTFGKDEVQEALDFARTIEPGSYSAPADDRYVIYAGTFLKSRNVEKLSQRFLTEGIKVYPEPVQVVRTLSRIRFGSFATREDAAVAAREVGEEGLRAEVVKSK